MKHKGIDDLFGSIHQAYNAAMIKMPTPKITRVLQSALERQQPPRAGLIRPKMRYAHQGGVNPPIIVIHGNALHNIKDSYTRYLIQTFRKAFQLEGTPLRVQYKSPENPFEEKREQTSAQPLRRAKLSNRIAKKEKKKQLKRKVKISVKKNVKS